MGMNILSHLHPQKMLPSITTEKRTRRIYSRTVKFHKDSDVVKLCSTVIKVKSHLVVLLGIDKALYNA